MTGFGMLLDRGFYTIEKKRFTLARMAVVAGTLVVIAGIGLKFSTNSGNLILALGGAVGMLGLLILYRMSRFEYGIIAIALSAGLLNFFTLPTGSQSEVVISLVAAMGMIGLWILRLLYPKSGERILPSPINAPIFAFVIVSFISYVWSNLLRDPLLWVWDSFPVVQLAALAVNVLLPLLALMVANKLKEVRWLKILAWIVVAIGTVAVFANLLDLPIDSLYSNGTRGVFIVWTGLFAFGLGLYDRRLSVWFRAFLLLVPFVWLWYTFALHAFFLSGWLPLMVAMIVLTFLRSKRLFLVVLLAAGLVLIFNSGKLYQRIVVANQEEGSAQRWDLWSTNLRLVSRHPLFGTGPAGYAIYYMTYNPQDARSTHNNYFDILAQTGVTGFAIFLWMMGAFGLTGFRVLRQVRGEGSFEEAYAAVGLAGLAGAMVAMMLGDWVLPFAYNQTITGFDNASYTWIFLGGTVSLYQILKARVNAPAVLPADLGKGA